MNQKIILMYSGQGSHYYQMGANLYQQNSVFRHWMQQADSLVQNTLKISLVEELYQQEHRKMDLFNNTLYTHPALFATQYALTQTLIEENIQPDYLLGTSLGEYISCAVAGVLSFETALEMIIEQAVTLTEACQEGRMLAILTEPTFFEQHPDIFIDSEIAAINFSQHFVVTTTPTQLSAIIKFLQSKDITYQELMVSRGFHSHLIDAAKTPFLNKIQKLTYHQPTKKIIACHDTHDHQTINQEYLWDIVRQPILFQQAIETLTIDDNMYFIDVGPMGTLATFLKYLLPEQGTKINIIMTPFGNEADNLQKVLAHFKE